MKRNVKWMLACAPALLVLFVASPGQGQNFTINGSVNATSMVGDSLKVRYEFSPGQSLAWAEVWIDLDHTGTITGGDYLLFESAQRDEFLQDGDFDDEDGQVNGVYESTLRDFFPLAPVTFIFSVSDSGGSSSATLNQVFPPFPHVIKGKIVNPENTANLFAFAAPHIDQIPPPPDGGHQKVAVLTTGARPAPRLQASAFRFGTGPRPADDPGAPCFDEGGHDGGPEGFPFVGTLTNDSGEFEIPIPDFISRVWEVRVADEFGMLDREFPPAPLMFSLDDSAAVLEFSFETADAVIRGLIRDQNGDLIRDAFGDIAVLQVGAYNIALGAGVGTRTVDGAFSFDVIAGEYELGIDELPDAYFRQWGQRVQVGSGDTAVVELKLFKRDAHISGRVTIGDSIGVPCVRFFAKSDFGIETSAVSDSNGFYSLDASVPANPWVVVVDTRSFPPGYRLDGPWDRTVDAPADSVDFILVKDDGPPPPPMDGHFRIASIKDIPEDQGLQVRVVWSSAGADRQNPSNDGQWLPDVTHYNLWRQGPPLVFDSSGTALGKLPQVQLVGSFAEMAQKASAGGDNRRYQIAGDPHVWDFIATIPAMRFPLYAYVAPTLHDSSATRPGWSYFVVSAHGNDPYFYLTTPPDSGYSADNLAPRLENVSAKITAAGVELSWETPETPDLVGARIYRGGANGFAAGAESLIGSTTGHTFVDQNGAAGSYYRIVAIDDAGNTTVSADIAATVTGVGDQGERAILPDQFVLEQNYPNPFNPNTVVSFGLPAAAKVRLEIFDLMGRRVKTLVAAELPAGYHTASWDGRDDSGQLVSSGVYLYKLTAGDTVLQRRMAFAK